MVVGWQFAVVGVWVSVCCYCCYIYLCLLFGRLNAWLLVWFVMLVASVWLLGLDSLGC